MPALNRLGYSGADPDMLYRVIAHSPHGSAMAAWHLEEGGVLNDYQVQGLVTFIIHADWPHVAALADEQGVVVPTPDPGGVDLAVIDADGEEDPHECRACHDEPEVHAERFGLNCSRCHTLDYWKPALLLRHTFRLDHGDEGQVACQTCHTASYATHTCYECHDHTPEGMRQAHYEEEIHEFENCAECHPTGREGEAANLGYGLSGQGQGNLREGTVEGAQPGLGELQYDEASGEWRLREPDPDPQEAAPSADEDGSDSSDPGVLAPEEPDSAQGGASSAPLKQAPLTPEGIKDRETTDPPTKGRTD
jgi:hypothetical protein